MSTLNIDNQSTEFGNTKSKFTNLLNPPLKIKKNSYIQVNSNYVNTNNTNIGNQVTKLLNNANDNSTFTDKNIRIEDSNSNNIKDIVLLNSVSSYNNDSGTNVGITSSGTGVGSNGGFSTSSLRGTYDTTDYLRFGDIGSSPNLRYVVFNGLNTIDCEFIEIPLIMGSSSNGGEKVDPNDFLTMQYNLTTPTTTDPGWVDINNNSGRIVESTDTNFYDWDLLSIPIPAGARASNVYFQIFQNSSGNLFDQFGFLSIITNKNSSPVKDVGDQPVRTIIIDAGLGNTWNLNISNLLLEGNNSNVFDKLVLTFSDNNFVTSIFPTLSGFPDLGALGNIISVTNDRFFNLTKSVMETNGYVDNLAIPFRYVRFQYRPRQSFPSLNIALNFTATINSPALEPIFLTIKEFNSANTYWYNNRNNTRNNGMVNLIGGKLSHDFNTPIIPLNNEEQTINELHVELRDFDNKIIDPALLDMCSFSLYISDNLDEFS